MKRLFAAAILLFLCVFFIPGMCEAIDFKSYSDSELLAMIGSIQKELIERQCFNEHIYLDSHLTVGVDLEPGFYMISRVGNNPVGEERGEVAIYETPEDSTYSLYQAFKGVDQSWMAELKDGNLVKTFRGIFSLVKVG